MFVSWHSPFEIGTFSNDERGSVLTVCEKRDVPTCGQKKKVLLPLLFSYGGIAKTAISKDFDTSMVFKFVLMWMKRDLELL